MATDLQAFGWAFAAVWGGLAAYFLYLHALEARLARDVRALQERLEARDLQGSGRNLK